MKILFLIDSLKAGGRERRLIELIKGLKNYQDLDLHLVVFSNQIHYLEIYNLDIPVIILERVPKKNPLVFSRLFKLCKTWKPDLIHTWATMSTIIAIPASILLKIKLINGSITDAPKNMGFFDERLLRARFTFPFSNVIVGNSHAGLLAYGVPQNKGVCIYNGFDIKRIKNLKEKTYIKERFNIQTKNVVGMVGSFSGNKDYRTFIEAALSLFKIRHDVTFMAIGGGPELTDHKALIPTEYVSRFIFTGLQKDVESIVNIFDVGVLSTNTKVHGEGISNAILEYMALEKPTVATYGGGTDEAIVDMKTGLLITPFSSQELASKIAFLLENPKKQKEMGASARLRLEDVFSLQNMTNLYLELYQNTLAQ